MLLMVMLLIDAGQQRLTMRLLFCFCTRSNDRWQSIAQRKATTAAVLTLAKRSDSFLLFLFFYSLLFHFLHYPSSSRQRLSVSMGEIINECGNGVSRLSREEAAAVENVVFVVESERGKEKGRFTTLLNSSSSSRSRNTLCQLLFSFSFPFSFCPILLLIALLLLMIDCEH